MSNVHPIQKDKPNYDKLFHKVEGLQAILVRGGVYKQVDLYRKLIDGEHRLFAKHGGGFIGLSAMVGSVGGTSHYGTSWLEIEADDGAVLMTGRLGRPCFDPTA